MIDLYMCPLATQIVQTKRCKCTNYNIKNECGSRAVYTFFLLYQHNIRWYGVTWVENWRDATDTGWYPCTPGGQHIAGNCCEMIINTNTPPLSPNLLYTPTWSKNSANSQCKAWIGKKYHGY
jgi:hypothetical protein